MNERIQKNRRLATENGKRRKHPRNRTILLTHSLYPGLAAILKSELLAMPTPVVVAKSLSRSSCRRVQTGQRLLVTTCPPPVPQISIALSSSRQRRVVAYRSLASIPTEEFDQNQPPSTATINEPTYLDKIVASLLNVYQLFEFYKEWLEVDRKKCLTTCRCRQSKKPN